MKKTHFASTFQLQKSWGHNCSIMTIITLSSSGDLPSTASTQLVQFLSEFNHNISVSVKAPSNLPRVQFNEIQNESRVVCPLVCIMYFFFDQRFVSSLCEVSNTNWIDVTVSDQHAKQYPCFSPICLNWLLWMGSSAFNWRSKMENYLSTKSSLAANVLP